MYCLLKTETKHPVLLSQLVCPFSFGKKFANVMHRSVMLPTLLKPRAGFYIDEPKNKDVVTIICKKCPALYSWIMVT